MQAPQSTYTCARAQQSLGPYLDNDLAPRAAQALLAHLASCPTCKSAFDAEQARLGVAGTVGTVAPAYGPDPITAAESQDQAPLAEDIPEIELEPAQGGASTLLQAAPWWLVSVALHGLVILLAGLLSLPPGSPDAASTLITLTELRNEEKTLELEQPKDIKASALDVPPVDPNAQPLDILIPPDVMAEIGDHFETINLDRPDTQSAYGTEESHIFYAASGNAEPAGGGGTDGNSIEDLIGVGGAGTLGSGGGFGGGHGGGIGLGTGVGKGSFGARSGGGRRFMVKRHGGSAATETAVDRALAWLARNQEQDGRWDTKKTEGEQQLDPGVTGLALLAFLGAGHNEKVGQYSDNVRRAIAWLISQQSEEGALGTNPRFRENHGGFGYHHAIAGMALAEAAGMDGTPATRQAAQKAIDYTCHVYQYGEGSEKLAWRYQPKAQKADLSVVGWYVMQLKSAKVAGLRVDPFSFTGAMRFVDMVETEPDKIKKEDDAYDNGRHRYGYVSKSPAVNTTSIGVLCRLFTGTKPEEVRGAAMYLLRTNPAAWHSKLGSGNAGAWPMYYMYYTTLNMFQIGDPLWKPWNEGMKKALVENQRQDGDFSGSWDPFPGWESRVGRAYTTALGALSLEVYYRYLKLDGR